MAPRTIAIRKNANGIDPISPIPLRSNDFPRSKLPSTNTRGGQNKTPVKSRFLNKKSATKQGMELDELKTKYEETKAQMEEMKRQKNENSKKLKEMSGLVKSLQESPVKDDKTVTTDGNNFDSVQKKIEAIMFEMEEAKKRYDELRKEKFFHNDKNDTVVAQETKIKSMEKQILLLNERLQKEELEQKETQKKVVEDQMADTEELEQQVMLQEMEISSLSAKIEEAKGNSGTNSSAHARKDIGKEIKFHEASNAAKYAEIQKMEEKLASMRDEQVAQKMQQVSIVKKHTEEQSGFVLKPTPTTCQEISKLEGDLADLRQEQETTTDAAENPEKLQKFYTSSMKPSIMKSQPWKSDMAWKENILSKKSELELVAKNDVNYEEEEEPESEDDEGQNQLAMPSLEKKKHAVGSVRSRNRTSAFGVKDRSVSSENSQSHEEPVSEENENKPGKSEKTKTLDDVLDNSSDTSATGESSTSSFSDAHLAAKGSMSDESSVTSGGGDLSNGETASCSSPKQEVELILHPDDGSVEAVSYTRPTLKVSVSHSSDEGSALSDDVESSVGTSSGSSSGVSNESSSGIYSSEESTAQSSSRSILEQIPEGVEAESDDSDWSESNKSVEDQFDNQSQGGSLVLRKQLKENESKYSKLMENYNNLISKSQLRMEKLQEENQKLRDGQGKVLSNMAKDSEASWLKEENNLLLKNMEKQNSMMEKQNRNLQRLEKKHKTTVLELADKKKRYDQLILDFSNFSNGGTNSEDYNRLKALHEAVALKLADVIEDNERLENERDDAVDQSEDKDVQIRAYDEAIAALNKTEFDLKNLQQVHGETVEELQELSEKNKELKDLYEKENANAKFSEKLQDNYVNAMTDMEMLTASNQEFKGIEDKLNTSEVKVAILEEEVKKSHEKLNATRKKSSARAGQLRDVISQYKSLKNDYSDQSDKLARLELVVGGLESKEGVNEMKQMEEALYNAKKEAAEAIEGKQARENDLKIVLQHYEKLQRKYESMKVDLDSKSIGSFDEEKKEDPKSLGELKKDDLVSMEDGSKHQEEVENLEKLLNESKDSMNWKNDKIAKTLSELKDAKEQIDAFETEKKELEEELSVVKSKLLLAVKQAENAGEREDSGQDKLRSAIAKHHQVQKAYDSLLNKYEGARAELEKNKKLIKVKEQEEKSARKRASTIHTQYKKLQEDHSVVVQRLEKIKSNMTNTAPAEC